VSTFKAGLELHPLIIRQQVVDRHIISRYLCRRSVPRFLPRPRALFTATAWHRLCEAGVGADTAGAQVALLKSLAATDRCEDRSLGTLMVLRL